MPNGIARKNGFVVASLQSNPAGPATMPNGIARKNGFVVASLQSNPAGPAKRIYTSSKVFLF